MWKGRDQEELHRAHDRGTRREKPEEGNTTQLMIKGKESSDTRDIRNGAFS